MRKQSKAPRIQWTPARAMFGSFSAVILLGALALMLPASSNGQNLSFIDALFTSTSAVCVTGLVLVDTAAQFTRLGQVIIMILIQLGGLGILTFTTWILMLAGRGAGAFERATANSTLGSLRGVGWRTILYHVLIWTATLETIGAGLLFLRWNGSMAPADALFHAIFHSVSAFCNAGFSTLRGGLVPFVSDGLVSLTITFLVVCGGLGFVVLAELAHYMMKQGQECYRFTRAWF